MTEQRLVTQRDLEALLRRLDRLERRVGLVETIEKPYYATGSYAPTYLGGTAPGVTTYAANGQVARWTRIGRVILFHGRLEWTAVTGTGNAQISLPPFTPANVTNLNAAVTLDLNGVTFANSAPQGLIQAGVSFFLMRSYLTNNATVVCQMEAAGTVNFAGHYTIE
jgi:hypothetical protein